jgi:hypothetical protein
MEDTAIILLNESFCFLNQINRAYFFKNISDVQLSFMILTINKNIIHFRQFYKSN